MSCNLLALSIAIVFPTVGWQTYDPTSITDLTLIGIRVLMGVFPIIVLGLGILSFTRFPITQEKYAEIKDKLEEIHSEKISKTD